jgi:hypothetical protein
VGRSRSRGRFVDWDRPIQITDAGVKGQPAIPLRIALHAKTSQYRFKVTQ